MGFIFVIALLSVGAWTLYATVGRLRSRQAGALWWSIFGSLSLIGVLIDYRLVFDL
jgi:hypothetical protein